LKEIRAQLDQNNEKVETLTERVDRGEEGFKAVAERLETLEETVENDRARTILQIIAKDWTIQSMGPRHIAC
jgi:hypothetical protein